MLDRFFTKKTYSISDSDAWRWARSEYKYDATWAYNQIRNGIIPGKDKR